MLFDEGGGNDTAFSTPVDEDTSGFAVDSTNEGEEGAAGIASVEGLEVDSATVQLLEFLRREGGG